MNPEIEYKTWKVVLSGIGKWLCVILFVMFILSKGKKNFTSPASFEQVSERVQSVLDFSTMEEADNQMIKRIYHLEPGDYENILCYYPTTNMDATEFLLIRFKSQDQAEAAVSAANARIASQMASFEGYGVTQYAMLEKSVVDASGGYLLYVTSDNSDAVDRTYAGALRGE